MTRVHGVLSFVMAALLVVMTPMAYAAERPAGTLSQADLDRAVAQRVGQDDAARGAIRALLQRDEVVAVADGYGLDLRQAEAAVGTLQGDELQSLATQAAQVDHQLAGGDTIVSISLVTLLLIVIIIILLTR